MTECKLTDLPGLRSTSSAGAATAGAWTMRVFVLRGETYSDLGLHPWPAGSICVAVARLVSASGAGGPADSAQSHRLVE